MNLHDPLSVRRRFLSELGGDASAIQQVLRYCENRFDRHKLPETLTFPLPDEPHLAAWRDYAAESGDGVFSYLQDRLPQLCIPIREGISKTPAYDEVVRRGRPFREESFGGKLTLHRPRQLRLVVHAHPAGSLPVLVTRHRPDFDALNRALAFRSEPVRIDASVNARMIAGLLNWDRVRRYRGLWTAHHGMAAAAGWGKEMKRVAQTEKWRFYDRLMLVCEHPYSGLSASQLGLDMGAAQWLQKSTCLRLEHEFTHYTTMRLYDYMGLNLFDETICDWAGMTLAFGGFEGRWFLRFLGLEDWPRIRPQGRVHSYRQELDDAAFALQCRLMLRVAEGVEALSRKYYVEKDRLVFLLALTRLTLELLAVETRESFFLPGYRQAQRLLGRPSS